MSKLERYLEDLDRALGPLPLSDRIDLLADTKRKALATSLGAAASAADLRRELGDPYELAAQFLRDRGFHAGKRASKTAQNLLRILVGGTMALTIFLFAAGTYLFWRFSPLVQIDEATQRIQLLGGYIDIDGKEGRLKVGESTLNADEFDRTLSITKTMDTSKTFAAEFTAGTLSIAQSADHKLRVQCRVKGASPNDPLLNMIQGKPMLQLGKTQGSRCELQLPPGTRLTVKGKSGAITLENLDAEAELSLGTGKIEVVRAGGPVKAQVDNGRIEFDPDPSREYRVDSQVEVGLNRHWDPPQGPHAIPVELRVKRGTIASPGAHDEEAE